MFECVCVCVRACPHLGRERVDDLEETLAVQDWHAHTHTTPIHTSIHTSIHTYIHTHTYMHSHKPRVFTIPGIMRGNPGIKNVRDNTRGYEGFIFELFGLKRHRCVSP